MDSTRSEKASSGFRVGAMRRLSTALTSIGERSDAFAAILIALVIFMMVLPLPAPAIDALIAVNVAMAALLIALALYVPNPVAFSSFPSVLLFTTLFRLGIEISTSRAILVSGEAGAIVETFGRYVAGDNVLVGFILFMIVAVVQFLVITRGAERVAEVAARFSLDSMPGRQMAIDADLRAGFARPETVQQMRGELARESRMHGAMDGAMRFVKGDAVAGFVIVLVNLTAGVATGVAQRDMGFSEALERYAILTIGNALVAQIPALLISLAAAILLTRGGDDGSARASTVGREIIDQAWGAPAAWLIAAGITALFAAVPGMPWYAFLALAGSMLASAVAQMRREAAARRQAAANASPAGHLGSGGSELVIPDECDVRQISPIRPIVISSSKSISRDARYGQLIRAARRARNAVVMRYGVTVPSIETEEASRLEDDAYEIAIHEVVVAHGRMRWNWLCVQADALDATQRSHTQKQTYPLIEGAVWIEQARFSDQAGAAQGVGAIDYFARLFEALLHRHAAQFVGIHEAQLLVGWLQREMPSAAKELAQAISLPRFAEVLRLLVAERVAVRNLKQIVEAIVSWAPKEKETAMLAEHVRLTLRAQICQEFASNGVIHAMLLERDLEDKLRASLEQTAQGRMLAVDHETQQSLLVQARRLARSTDDGRGHAPVLLTTQDLRRPLRLLVLDDWFDLHVLSYAELTPGQPVRSIGTLAADETNVLPAGAPPEQCDG